MTCTLQLEGVLPYYVYGPFVFIGPGSFVFLLLLLVLVVLYCNYLRNQHHFLGFLVFLFVLIDLGFNRLMSLN